MQIYIFMFGGTWAQKGWVPLIQGIQKILLCELQNTSFCEFWKKVSSIQPQNKRTSAAAVAMIITKENSDLPASAAHTTGYWLIREWVLRERVACDLSAHSLEQVARFCWCCWCCWCCCCCWLLWRPQCRSQNEGEDLHLVLRIRKNASSFYRKH